MRNNLCGKLVSLVLVMFDDSSRVTPVSFFVAGFTLLSCESDNFTFTLL